MSLKNHLLTGASSFAVREPTIRRKKFPHEPGDIIVTGTQSRYADEVVRHTMALQQVSTGMAFRNRIAVKNP